MAEENGGFWYCEKWIPKVIALLFHPSFVSFWSCICVQSWQFVGLGEMPYQVMVAAMAKCRQIKLIGDTLTIAEATLARAQKRVFYDEE
jgi:hypothetical protein